VLAYTASDPEELERHPLADQAAQRLGERYWPVLAG